MRITRPLRALIAALALAVAGGGASAASATADPPILPAPPPASYCRVAPPAGWPAISGAPVADLTPWQDYRGGLGIDAGLDGEGVRIADVEYEWGAGHADLAPRGLPAAAASGVDPAFRARDHGTAVLGILGAAPDGRGITGLATGATLLPISPMFPGAAQSYQPVAAIEAAADKLEPGDILLIELQALVLLRDGTTLLGPIEFYPTVRAAIAEAVSRGIVVVEPAGNGDLDVGTLGPTWLSDAEDPLATGALMVGAGGSGLGEPPVPDRERVPGSNWGQRVDLQGYGAAVVTTGYADLSGGDGSDPDLAYTACFDGTSSASATVAGAAAVLQAEAIRRTGAPLTPAEVRDLLVSTGLPQAQSPGDEGADPQNIGPRPQVDDALAALGDALVPPPSVPDGAVVDAPAPPAPTTPVAAAPVVAPPAIAAAGSRVPVVRAPAVRGLATRYDRRARRLVVTLRGAAPQVAVEVGGRRVAVRAGTLVLRGIGPGRVVVSAGAPARAGTSYTRARFRISIAQGGGVRVTRL